MDDDVRSLAVGDRVIIPSILPGAPESTAVPATFYQCNVCNPNSKQAGTGFYSDSKPTDLLHGLQAEKARIPFANTRLVKLTDEISGKQAVA